MTDLLEKMTDTLDELAGEDTLDGMCVHGALTAWAISGGTKLPADFAAHVFGDDLADVPKDELTQLEAQWQEMLDLIHAALYDDTDLELPFDITLDWEDSEQQAWAVGFMEIVFAHENAFAEADEDEFAELLLPIQVASGLFMEEDIFADVYKDDDLLISFLNQVPEVLVDMYLLFNSPEK
ncbi:YecA family protein [Salinispirillum sp. LH 10-3-1]|uniref:YecA family protein n=1 Tax=Salinispirillum sp. LH 10-3-1 TaxID=2952525 RepID=A0AB38YJT9_9GAMM